MNTIQSAASPSKNKNLCFYVFKKKPLQFPSMNTIQSAASPSKIRTYVSVCLKKTLRFPSMNTIQSTASPSKNKNLYFYVLKKITLVILNLLYFRYCNKIASYEKTFLRTSGNLLPLTNSIHYRLCRRYRFQQ